MMTPVDKHDLITTAIGVIFLLTCVKITVGVETTIEEPLASSTEDYVEPIYLTRLIKKYEEESRDALEKLQEEKNHRGLNDHGGSYSFTFGGQPRRAEKEEINNRINDIRDKERIRAVVVDFIQRMMIEDWKQESKTTPPPPPPQTAFHDGLMV